jgi:hypothetical protein
MDVGVLGLKRILRLWNAKEDTPNAENNSIDANKISKLGRR